MRECSNCDEAFGYDAGYDDPPVEGQGHLEVVWNPVDSIGVRETFFYCSLECLQEDDERPDINGGEQA